MENNNVNPKYDPHSGLLTKIWGPALWESIHCITFGYPIEPSEEHKKYFKIWFETLQYVMPCKYCRESYSEFIKSEPTKLTDDVFANRESLTKWAYLLHERVNIKLGVDYKVTYEHICHRYEAFRAKCVPGAHGCLMPADLKSKSFETAAYKDCPVIPLNLAVCFKEYAEKRGVPFDKLDHYENILNNIESDEWTKRNNECRELITRIRFKGVSSCESDGEYKDLPTVDELKLISKLSSTLGLDDLIIMANKLGHNLTRLYKLQII